MKNVGILLILGVLAGSPRILAAEAAAPAPAPPVDPSGRLFQQAAVMLLREGNARYISGKAQHPNLDAERRASTVSQGQEPFATILACSDSREPVELIFDRGVGDLFVVRVAGNIAGVSELATVEYGVGHLHTPVLVVMGHSKCGAVTAVVKGAALHGHLKALGAKIQPAADKAKAESSSVDETIPRAIEANVWQTISDILKQSGAVREQAAAGRLQIIGAVYDLESGKVNWLGAHPDLESLLVAAPESAAPLARAEVPSTKSAPPKESRSELSSRNLLQFLKPEAETPPVREAHAPGPLKPSATHGH